MYRSVFPILLLLISGKLIAGSDSDSILYSNHVYNEKIKTVQIFKEGWNLSYPVLKLKSNDKLVLSFDLLDAQAETYYYTFIHCDKDWNKSDIQQNDYLTGDYDNPVENYESSFNTTVNYIHYKITFPNDRVNLTLSGNYIVKVYPADKPEEPVLTRRFIITEDVAGIEVTFHRPLSAKDNNSQQQADVTVNYTNLQIPDPYRNIFLSVLQNGRWDDSRNNLKPDITGNNELRYNSLNDKIIFYGGNEYRYFDIKTIKYQTEFVKRIDFSENNYNVYLHPSENREFKPYFYWKDFNGNYYIAYQEGKKPDIQSDYVYVYFTLPSDQMIPGGNFYVAGALNNWTYDKNNILTYNPGKKQYECTMFLKQGWYNYEYAFVKNGETGGTVKLFEGNHYETENDYLILVYLRHPHDRYDRVIGTLVANTLNHITN